MSGGTKRISKKDKTDENRENRSVSVSVSVSVSRRALIAIYCIAVKWGFIDQKLAWVHECIFDSQSFRGWRGREETKAVIFAQVNPSQLKVNSKALFGDVVCCSICHYKRKEGSVNVTNTILIGLFSPSYSCFSFCRHWSCPQNVYRGLATQSVC
jgi:hypothetical protein